MANVFAKLVVVVCIINT